MIAPDLALEGGSAPEPGAGADPVGTDDRPAPGTERPVSPPWAPGRGAGPPGGAARPSSGWTHRSMFYDGYIYLHVVQNILAGHGPVFNAGQRVEAFTSPAVDGPALPRRPRHPVLPHHPGRRPRSPPDRRRPGAGGGQLGPPGPTGVPGLLPAAHRCAGVRGGAGRVVARHAGTRDGTHVVLAGRLPGRPRAMGRDLRTVRAGLVPRRPRARPAGAPGAGGRHPGVRGPAAGGRPGGTDLAGPGAHPGLGRRRAPGLPGVPHGLLRHGGGQHRGGQGGVAPARRPWAPVLHGLRRHLLDGGPGRVPGRSGPSPRWPRPCGGPIGGPGTWPCCSPCPPPVH